MIDDKVRAETNLSTCEQNISLYENRIQSLKSGTQKSGVSELVEKDFEKLNNKIHTSWKPLILQLRNILKKFCFQMHIKYYRLLQNRCFM